MNHWPIISRAPAQRSVASLQRQYETKSRSDYYPNVIPMTGHVLRHTSKADPPPKTCQYIIGEPSRTDIRKYGSDRFMCRDATKPNSPYCEAHHARCYTKPLTGDGK